MAAVRVAEAPAGVVIDAKNSRIRTEAVNPAVQRLISREAIKSLPGYHQGASGTLTMTVGERPALIAGPRLEKRVIFTCGEQPTALLRLTLDVQAREVYFPSGWALSLGSVKD